MMYLHSCLRGESGDESALAANPPRVHIDPNCSSIRGHACELQIGECTYGTWISTACVVIPGTEMYPSPPVRGPKGMVVGFRCSICWGQDDPEGLPRSPTKSPTQTQHKSADTEKLLEDPKSAAEYRSSRSTTSAVEVLRDTMLSLAWALHRFGNAIEKVCEEVKNGD